MQKFEEAGYKICKIDEIPDIYVVNTCTVTNIADRKSRQALRKVKEKNKDLIVVAVGCYAQIAGEKLQEIEEIDIVLGNKEKKDIVKYVENYLDKKNKQNFAINNKQNLSMQNKEEEYTENSNEVYVANIAKQKDFDEYGLVTYTEKTRATIKIQDGCNNFCSYCLIPYARGRVRSRSKDRIIQEVTKISKKGIKEVVLTGIHIASYGKDFEEDYKLIDLLEDLNKIDGIQRIRLGSLEPTIVTEEFAKRLSKLEKICNQFHLSLQSGCNETLKRMNRKYTIEEFRNVTQILRKYFKDVNLTTDIIVGFPGETEEEFNKTYEFLKEISFYKMHIFKYSPREGTVATKLPNQINGKTKDERSQKLIELSNKNQTEYNKKYLGKIIEVLFEEEKDGIWSGYTKNYIKVNLKSDANIENKIIKVIPKELEEQEITAVCANDTSI